MNGNYTGTIFMGCKIHGSNKQLNKHQKQTPKKTNKKKKQTNMKIKAKQQNKTEIVVSKTFPT